MPTDVTRRRALRGVLLSAVVAGAAVISACGNDDPQAAQQKGGPNGGAMPPMPVTVVEANKQAVPIQVDAVGQAEGSKQVEVRARVPGILMKQTYQEGDRVKAGQTLFVIDRAANEIALSQAQAQLAQDRANLEKAEREAARLKPLVAEKAISQREYDDATSALAAARAAVQAGSARLRDAQLDLSYTTVAAPISGVTGRAVQSLGSLVSTSGESSLLTTIHVTDPIWVRFALSDAEALQLRRAGAKAEATLELSDGSVYETKGKLNFQSSSVDTRTGMVSMRAEFPNPKLLLLPGQFVRVKVTTGAREAFLVPQSALSQNDQGKIVFTVSPENTVAPRPVQTAGWYGQNWIVTDGLKPGDKVITDNLMKLRPGAPVAPHAPGQGPGAPPAANAAAPAKGGGAKGGEAKK